MNKWIALLSLILGLSLISGCIRTEDNEAIVNEEAEKTESEKSEAEDGEEQSEIPPQVVGLENQLDACDDISGWVSDNDLSLDGDQRLEGQGALVSTGEGIVQFRKHYSIPFNTGVDEGNGLLTLWYYVSDASAISTNGWIEISINPEERYDAYSWKFSTFADRLKDGWNYLQLDISRADKYGFPDLTAIEYINIQTGAKDPVTTMIDDIRFSRRQTGARPTDHGLVYEAVSQGENEIVASEFSDMTYTFEHGDYLEYDVYLRDYAKGLGGIDFVTEDGSSLEQVEGWYDTTRRPARASLDLTVQAYNHWHHRKIRIPADFVGKTVTSWQFVAMLEEGQSKATSVYDNIHINDMNGHLQMDLFSTADEATLEMIESNPHMSIDTVGNIAFNEPNPKVIETRFPTDDIVIADFIATDEIYGAVGDGVTDDTHAIQKALDDCYYSGGGTVWLPEGKYRITSPIHIGAFVTLRGDWNDPDLRVAPESYGTVIIADVKSTKDAKQSLFRIGGSAGAMGLTVYYPNQNLEDPLPYPHTFVIPGGAWVLSPGNYMSNSIVNCTLLNAYKGIGVSTMPNELGFSAMTGQTHEMENIDNVKGTPLYVGAEGYNSADVGTWRDITFSSSYWADAGIDEFGYDFNPAGYTREDISGWTRENAIGLKLGDFEWAQFYNITIEDYEIGVKTVAGYRAAFAGLFTKLTVKNSDVAFRVDSIDLRWGLGITRSSLEGETAAVLNRTGGNVKIADTILDGEVTGDYIDIIDSFTSPEDHKLRESIPRPTLTDLYVVAPDDDVDDDAIRIQEALNMAGDNGGGTVYLQAGKFSIRTPMLVPTNVELRGVSAVPTRDQYGRSEGTVLFAYYGKGIDDDSVEAMISLEESAGIRGIRVFYPENNPKGGVDPYPYTIRSLGDSIYIINTGVSNGYKIVDFKTNESSDYYIRKLIGCAYDTGIYLGGKEGWIEDTLQNATNAVRNAYGIPGWFTEVELFSELIIPITTQNTTWIKLDGAKNVHLLNNFTYGCKNVLLAENESQAIIFNIGADGLGDGISVDGTSNIIASNFMKLHDNVTEFIFEIYNYLQLL